VADAYVRIVREDGDLLRELTLDPGSQRPAAHQIVDRP
jgi:hypothetical protein